MFSIKFGILKQALQCYSVDSQKEKDLSLAYKYILRVLITFCLSQMADKI